MKKLMYAFCGLPFTPIYWYVGLLLIGCAAAPKSGEPIANKPDAITIVQPPENKPVPEKLLLTPALDGKEEGYIDEALKMLNMTRKDTEFPKALENDPYRLVKVQNSLDKPLELPAECDKINQQWREATTLTAGLKIQIDQMEPLSPTITATPTTDLTLKKEQIQEIKNSIKKCPKEFQPVIKSLLTAIYQAQILMDKAFANLPLAERQYLVKYTLGKALMSGNANPEDFEIEADKVELALAGPDAKVIQEGRDVIDPEEMATLKLALKIDYNALYQAGMLEAEAVDNAMKMLEGLNLFPHLRK